MAYSIKIQGQKFDKFNNLSISHSIDSVASSFSFDVNYSEEDKHLFKPLQYQDIQLFEDDQLILSGTFINYSFTSDENINVVGISGYSKGGILEDITMPIALESNNKTLNEIVTSIFNKLNIKFIVDASVQKEMNIKFTKSVASERDTIKDYISKLAAQRNIIISHDKFGNVLFFRPTGNGSAKILFTKENCIAMNMQVNGQSMYYSTTIQRQPPMPKSRKKKGENNKKPILKTEDSSINILVADQRRITANIMTSGEDGDTKLASENALADQYKNISLSVDLQGKCPYSIGDIVEVKNDEVYLYQKCKFIISAIEKNITSESEKYSLTLNIPETYTGKKLTRNIFDL